MDEQQRTAGWQHRTGGSDAHRAFGASAEGGDAFQLGPRHGAYVRGGDGPEELLPRDRQITHADGHRTNAEESALMMEGHRTQQGGVPSADASMMPRHHQAGESAQMMPRPLDLGISSSSSFTLPFMPAQQPTYRRPYSSSSSPPSPPQPTIAGGRESRNPNAQDLLPSSFYPHQSLFSAPTVSSMSVDSARSLTPSPPVPSTSLSALAHSKLYPLPPTAMVGKSSPSPMLPYAQLGAYDPSSGPSAHSLLINARASSMPYVAAADPESFTHRAFASAPPDLFRRLTHQDRSSIPSAPSLTSSGPTATIPSSFTSQSPAWSQQQYRPLSHQASAYSDHPPSQRTGEPNPMGATPAQHRFYTPSHQAERAMDARLSCPDFHLSISDLDNELTEDLYIFTQNYQSHCREVFEAVEEGRFASAQEAITRFWPLVEGFTRLLSHQPVIEQIIRFDKLFYDAVTKVAVSKLNYHQTGLAKTVCEFAHSLPCWTFYAASGALPGDLFHPKMTLLRRSSREILLMAQVFYFGGKFANSLNADSSVQQITSEPAAKRARSGPEDDDYTWDVKGGRYSREAQLRRVQSGSDAEIRPSAASPVNEPQSSLPHQMLQDWNALNMQGVVNDLMQQYGRSLWSVAFFSPVGVCRLIAGLLDENADIGGWTSSFVEPFLIREMLLDSKDTGSPWYESATLEILPRMNDAKRASPPSGRMGQAASKPLSDSHAFYMQWRCFSTQVLTRLEINRALSVSTFNALFSWIDAVLSFFLDKRRSHFLSSVLS